jgi:hypothetical protein
MNGPTNISIYEIALRSLGFPPLDGDVIPSVAARTLPTSGSTASARDSVYMVLNPETPRYALHLPGKIAGDNASGVWVAESFLGGGGRFALRWRAL